MVAPLRFARRFKKPDKGSSDQTLYHEVSGGTKPWIGTSESRPADAAAVVLRRYLPDPSCVDPSYMLPMPRLGSSPTAPIAVPCTPSTECAAAIGFYRYVRSRHSDQPARLAYVTRTSSSSHGPQSSLYLPAPAPAAAAIAPERKKREYPRTTAGLTDCPHQQPPQLAAHPPGEQSGCHHVRLDKPSCRARLGTGMRTRANSGKRGSALPTPLLNLIGELP